MATDSKKHTVLVENSPWEMGNADTILTVKTGENNEIYGKFKASKGGMVFTPRNHTHGFFIAWEDLGFLIERRGIQERSRSRRRNVSVR